MRIKIEADVTIDRPPADVFAVVTDVAHQPDWSWGVDRVVDLSDNPVRLGSTWTQFSRILGRRIEVHAKVTDLRPDQRFEFTVDKPTRIEMLWCLEPTPTGTHVSVTAEGNPGLFYGLVKPMVGALRAALADDLGRLKKRLEAAP
jgi:uncharacterized protein YndB with AHSA1/START domain